MATYNGAAFLDAQLDSILTELGTDDEIIVVDDASTDETTSLVLRRADIRIQLHINPVNMGTVRSFERALSLARGDVLFMADQDDVWVPGRVRRMTERLISSDAWLVSSNSAYINTQGNAIDCNFAVLFDATSRDHLANIGRIILGRGCYWGCAMAIRRDLLEIVLPIPKHVQSHDIWIALAANIFRKNVHHEEKLLLRRLHGDNASLKRRSIPAKLWSRALFVASILTLVYRAACLR